MVFGSVLISDLYLFQQTAFLNPFFMFSKKLMLPFTDNIKKEFDSDPVCNKKFLKTKIKSHGDEVTDILKKNS